MADVVILTPARAAGYWSLDYEWRGIRRVWRCPKETMQRLDDEVTLRTGVYAGYRISSKRNEVPS
jgi:hypothetical protein